MNSPEYYQPDLPNFKAESVEGGPAFTYTFYEYDKNRTSTKIGESIRADSDSEAISIFEEREGRKYGIKSDGFGRLKN